MGEHTASHLPRLTHSFLYLHAAFCSVFSSTVFIYNKAEKMPI